MNKPWIIVTGLVWVLCSHVAHGAAEDSTNDESPIRKSASAFFPPELMGRAPQRPVPGVGQAGSQRHGGSSPTLAADVGR